MKILVACEESQAVTIELRKLGHEAYSCDIEPCSGGHPEWHLQQDVTPLLKEKWDMIIAFPPCTYLSNAGARHLYPKGVLNKERYKKGLQAKEFFMQLYNADCLRIAVENPIPSKIYNLPKYSQVIQPYQFGHPFKKRTQLWLKGLPKLIPTEIIEASESTKIPGNWFNKGGKDRQKNRAKTFPGIAKAMAEQWTK
ncbi:DNA cytosine methyltransferase [Clostridium sporogenes]|uniref:DNA cytosine methyltransferase n=1 Tax=Clostridium sporogenes TaxID=1509 RepID=UPI0022370B02|nr:DNA cytosine methyltransferase [Clostridium sporogenes]MCW6112174.1 DNA cytosine methyltransferase [Clostridium sporogenes]